MGGQEGTGTGGGAPTGAAGGDLTGTYPNPTLAAVVSGATVGGSSKLVRSVTYDAKGRITGSADVDLGALATGLLKNTTSTGALSIATANTDYAHPSATYVVQTATNAPGSAQVLATLATGLLWITTATGVLSAATAANLAGTVIDGTGLTTTIPATIINGKSQSGLKVQVSGTVPTGVVLADSGGTVRGAFGYAVALNDWITQAAAGDIVLLGDTSKFIRLGVLGAANTLFNFDLGNSRLGIGVGSNTPSYAIHILGSDTAGARMEIAQSTASSQAMFELTRGSCALSAKACGATTSGNGLGIALAGAVTLIGDPTASGMLVGTNTAFPLYLGAGNAVHFKLTPSVGPQVQSCRFQQAKGADVASAATLTLGADGSVFGITGTTAIDFITTTNWQAGSIVTLRFAGAATVNHNTGSPPGSTAPILLSGSANITFAANTVLRLVYDGTNWIDLRKVA